MDRLFGITGGDMKIILALIIIWIVMPATIMGSIPPDQRANLITLYYSTGGSDWTNNTGWLGPVGTECEWYGVACDWW